MNDTIALAQKVIEADKKYRLDGGLTDEEYLDLWNLQASAAPALAKELLKLKRGKSK